MGGQIRDDWMKGAEGVSNALGQYYQRGLQNRKIEQDQRQFEAQNLLARDQFGELKRQFGMSNAIAQRTADRADTLAPGQLEVQKMQIAQAMSQARSEAEMHPLIMELKRTELELARAKATGKDAETQRFNQLFGDPPQPQAAPPPQQQPGYTPGVRPQSFQGVPPQPMAPMPVVDTAGARNPLAPQQDDASLILTQEAAPQAPPQPQAQPNAPPSVRDIVKNMTPAQQAQLMLSWTGKGDAAKVIGEAANVQQLGKETRNKIDEQEMKAVNATGRLKQIMSGYKDEWLTWEGQFKQYGAALLDKSGALRSKMSPEQVQSLEEYSGFMRDVNENLTQGITEATGAAMGVEEAKRIMKGIPNPDDSPTQFKSKAVSSFRALEMSQQRTQFLRQHGFKGNGDAAEARMPLGQFDKLLKDSRGLYQQLKSSNPGADDRAIRNSVREIIARRYRISA
jgi:hypothetical protein